MKIYSVYYKADDGSKQNVEVRASNILVAIPFAAMKLRIKPAAFVRDVWAVVDVEENQKKPDEPEEKSR